MLFCAFAAVAVSLFPAPAAAPVPEDFVGLSFEATQVNSVAPGRWYFDPANRPLLDMFQRLGVRHLRVGGNTSDIGAHQLPNHEDLDRLFAFAAAAQVKVLYCLRLADGDPEQDAAVVEYLVRRYGNQIDAFTIGQEPSAYPSTGKGRKLAYDDYAPRWRRYADIIRARVPGVALAGPSVHNDPAWTGRFLADFGTGHNVKLVTAHLYPGGSGRAVDPAQGIRRMLGPDFAAVDLKLGKALAASAGSLGLPFRIEEGNSFYNGGAAGVSDTYASTLWGLDFILWWASHGAAGIDFHSGDRVSAGAAEALAPAKYTAYCTAADGKNFELRPLGYGLVAARLALGRIVLEPRGTAGLGARVHVYGFRSQQSETLVALNLDYGTGASASVIAWSGSDSPRTEVSRVVVASGAVSARTGITVSPWGPASPTVEVPPASAVILRRTLPGNRPLGGD